MRMSEAPRVPSRAPRNLPGPGAPVHLAAALLLALGTWACGGQDGPLPGPGAPPAARALLQPVPVPAAEGALAPSLATGAGGVLLSWIEPAAGAEHQAVRLARLESSGGAVGWSEPETVVEGADFFANWADVPAVLPVAGGRLYAHWLRRAGEGTYSYHVEMARREGPGEWTRLGRVHVDDSASEHGFVSLVPEGSGVRVFWLDGQAMATHEDGEMSLRTALVEGTPGGETVLDARVCECCRTSAAVAAAGPVVVYRDRTADEVRDISIVRRTPSGWSEPAPVHVDGWVVPGCPVNGPAVAAHPGEADSLAVAWYTAPGNEPQVRVAFSRDGGATFSPPVRVDEGRPLGRTDLIWDGGGVLVVWLEAGEGEGATLRARRLAPDDALPAPAVILTETLAARSSGFPRLAQAGDRPLLVWTLGGKPTRLASALLDPSLIPAAAAGAATTPRPEARSWDGRPGSRAPAYAARDLEGRAVELASFRGQPVLLNVWATWCAPCRAEIPALADVHRRYRERGLAVVGVSVDEAAARPAVRRLLEEEKVPYATLHDPEDRASSVFGLSFLPGTFLFDAEGVLVWRRNGVVEDGDPELARALERVLDAGT